MTALSNANTASARPLRFGLFAVAVITLLVGIFAGLSRLQITVPDISLQFAAFHGPLLISGFFGVVISLERAVAVKTATAYAAPVLNAVGTLLLLLFGIVAGAQLLAIAAATVLTVVSLQLLRKVKADFTVILAGSAACWSIGGMVWWFTNDTARATLLWFAFLIITIAGERLELTRLLGTPQHAKRWCHAIVVTIMIGALGYALVLPGAGTLFSVGLTLLAAWLIRYDLARHNMRQTGMTRYIAACLLSGYGWLGLAGVLGLLGAFVPGSPLRDSALHALGLGFVMAMVFGHALIIFPAIARIKVAYHAAFYIPLALLHGSLALRVAGKVLDITPLQQFGAIANALTFIFFAVVMVWGVRKGRNLSRRPATHG